MTGTTFAAAYEKGYSSTVRFLISIGVPADKADDAAQAGWARGWERREQLKEPGKIVSWVNRISLNLFRNQLRSQQLTEEIGDPGCRPRINATTVDVRDGLSRCSPEDADLLRSYYLEGYSSSELGLLKHCSPEAIRVRVLRAKRRFIGFLELGSDSRSQPNELRHAH